MIPKILIVAGARPNFMKIAPIIHALKARNETHGVGLQWRLIHTGQHYDYNMSKVVFEELDVPMPDYFLKAGSGTHAEQTAKIMVEFEAVALKENHEYL